MLVNIHLQVSNALILSGLSKKSNSSSSEQILIVENKSDSWVSF